MRKYVIMGVQGSGKGTQSELLCDDLDLVHIAVGDIFRWHVQNHTKLGAQVRRIMNAGELVGEKDVLAVAAAWSIDPTTLTGRPAPGPLRLGAAG